MKAKSNIDYTFDALNDEYYKFEMFCDMKLKKEEN